MRKLLVGLIVVGLLAVASPAMAWSVPGTADPLGLLISGAVLPYFGNTAGTQQSWLEAYAPATSSNLHMFFFNETCVRSGDSVNLALTPNDVEFLRVDNFGGSPVQGLVTIADTDAAGFTLRPISAESPVNLRMLWVDLAASRGRVLEPIVVQTASNFWSNENWANLYSPMRTAAAFYAPLEAGAYHTTIYFVCPNDNVIGTKSTSAFRVSATGDPTRFPRLLPAAQSSDRTTPLRVRVYDDEEHFLRDVTSTCECLSVKPVTSISSVYANSVEAPFGTYTEVEGGTQSEVAPVCSTTEIVTATASNPCPYVPGTEQTAKYKLVTPGVASGGPFSFVAWRAITVGPLDIFGRVSGGSRGQLQGDPTDTSR